MVNEGEIHVILRKIGKSNRLREEFFELLEEAFRDASLRDIIREIAGER